MRVLLTRPKEDSEPLARRLAEMGHETVVAPLMEIVFLPEAELRLDGAQALLATSSNGVRALAAHPKGAAALRLPLLAVGDATARAAREVGFSDVRVAGGDVEALAALAKDRLKPEEGRLVHIVGRDRAGDLKAALAAHGFNVEVVVLYVARAEKKLPAAALEGLQAGILDAVLLYSPRTARIYADVVLAEGDALIAAARKLTHLCLSPAVAAALGPLKLDPGRVLVAAEPRQDALLERLGEGTPAGSASP